MNEDQSSSNRGPGVCDAIVAMEGCQVGVIRLPRNRAADFVDQFNRTYQGLGLALLPLPPSAKDKKIPASNDADGDSLF